MENCRFCDIVNEKIKDHRIWENDKFLAFLDINPVNPGHCLLIPKKHVDYLFDLDDNLYQELFKTAKKLAEPLKISMNAKKIGITVAGFAIPHVHIHLVPLHGSNEMFGEKEFRRAPEKELKQVQEKLANCLRNLD